MAYEYTQLENGDILVEDVSKNLSQTITPLELPYEIWYNPANGGVYVIKDLSLVETSWVRIRTEK